MLLASEDFTLRVARGVNPRRFIRAFAAVWRRLPPGARHCLIAAWYPRSGPRFSLVRSRRFIGLFRPPHYFDWSADELEHIDARSYAMVLAHELGHGVYFAADGRPGTEEEVNELVENWGFAVS